MGGRVGAAVPISIRCSALADGASVNALPTSQIVSSVSLPTAHFHFRTACINTETGLIHFEFLKKHCLVTHCSVQWVNLIKNIKKGLHLLAKAKSRTI